MEDIITIKNLNYSYCTNGVRHEIFRNFSLSIHRSETISLIGPSGAGKTTLAKLLAGYLSPDKGDILIDGERNTRPNSKRILIHQEDDLFEWMTVDDHMNLVCNDKNRISTFLKLVRLENFRNNYPSALSGGMRKRLSIARALAKGSEILIMDEPFSSLDSSLKNELQEDILRVGHDTNATIVLITHNVSEAVFLSDRIVLLGGDPLRVTHVLKIPLPKTRKGVLLKSEKFSKLCSHVQKHMSRKGEYE